MVARKGQPNIGNDPGYKPDWKDTVQTRVSSRNGGKRFMFRTTWEFVGLLSRAARLRGMTNSAYARRAVSAFIANDLQIPFEDVCKTSPGVEHVALTNEGVVWPPDDGVGYGNWKVQP